MISVAMDGRGGVSVVTVPRPRPSANEVVVRCEAVGICHSDIELLHGTFITPVAFPLVPGHEWVGVVDELGPGVSRVARGDRVVGECRIGIDDYFGLNTDGAASEWFLAREEWLHRVPTGLPSTSAALVEPFTVAYYGACVHGPLVGGSTAAVLGAGTIGQCAVALLSASGVEVIVVDPDEGRRRLAVDMGATYAVEPGPLLRARIEEFTDGRGADLVIEASGASAALADALRVARQFGRITFVGFNLGEQVSSELGLIQSKDLTIRGITGSPGVWPEAIDFLAEHAIDLSPLVTATFPLSQATQAFASATDGRQVKVQLVA